MREREGGEGRERGWEEGTYASCAYFHKFIFVPFRMYRVLPEVKDKHRSECTQRERLAHRLKARLFNKVALYSWCVQWHACLELG